MEWKPDVGYEDGLIWIPKERAHLRQIKAALTFIYGNADYRNTKKFSLYRERKDHIGIPRHFLNRDSLASMGMEMVDLQPQGYEEIDIYSSIQPDALQPGKTMQSDAITAALSKGDGIVSLACGNGKTLVGLHIWAQLRVPLVVMADNTSILDQSGCAIVIEGRNPEDPHRLN